MGSCGGAAGVEGLAVFIEVILSVTRVLVVDAGADGWNGGVTNFYGVIIYTLSYTRRAVDARMLSSTVRAATIHDLIPLRSSRLPNAPNLHDSPL